MCTPENEQIVGELICSQEDRPGTHLSPRKTDKYTGIDRSAVKRMVKRKGYKQFKRLKTPRMNDGRRLRRTERAKALARPFGSLYLRCPT